MTNKGSQQIIQYRTELKNIINTLRTIENGIRKDFKNIGNDRCADSIHSVIEKYESALKTLNSINTKNFDKLISDSKK